MSKKFHKLSVSSVQKETESCVVVSFDVPSELHEDFTFVPGQYLTLEALIDGEEVRRSYSLCSAPYERKWKVAIKEVEGGKFSTFANSVLNAGDSMNVLEPDGNFKLNTNETNSNNYLLSENCQVH